MDKLILCAIGYALLLTGGLRAVWEEKRKGELALFTSIVLYCGYMTCSKLFDWPSGSIARLHYFMYADMGRWLERMLGSTG